MLAHHSRNLIRLQNLQLQRFAANSTLSKLLYSTSPASAAVQRTGENDPHIVRSPTPDMPEIVGVTMPEYVRSLATAGNWGSSIAFECPLSGFKITHDDVWKVSKSFAAALLKTELKRGDTVGIVLPNHPLYASVLYGIWDAGLVASPVNPSYSPEEIARQLTDSQAKWAVTIPLFLPAIQAAQKNSPLLKQTIVIGAEPGVGLAENCHHFSEMIKTDPSGAKFLKGSQINTKEEVAILPYSSGTTGLPKGVMLTHANIATHLSMLTYPGVIKFTNYEGPGQQERLLGLLPMFHCFGMTNFCMVNMIAGAYVVVLPKFEPALFLNTIRKYKPTILHLVPPLINMMAASPDYGKAEFEAVHTVVGGAAPIGTFVVNKLLDKAGKYFFFQEVYGMTEMSPGTHTLREESANKKIGSCGVLIPNTISKIVTTDGTNKSLGRNMRGEVCVKGPHVMKGYWNNEEATKQTIDADGWLHSGDIGYYDDDDHLYIVDRLKELIKVKGHQVAPAELEELLRTHPDVADSAVIGIPDAEAGELPRAYIVKRNPDLSADMVNKFLKEKVIPYKQLKGGIEFLEAIPKAPSGKILRRELKRVYFEKHGLKMPE